MKIASLINLTSNEKKYWLKIFTITLLATGIFYSFMQIFAASESKPPIPIPENWQKIELTLQGNYLAQEGEFVSIVENNGSLILKKGLLLEIKRTETTSMENPFGNMWKALIATEALNNQKLKELNTKKPDQLFLSPYDKDLRVAKRTFKKDMAHEINY